MRILAAGPGRSRADEGAPRFFAARRNGHPILCFIIGGRHRPKPTGRPHQSGRTTRSRRAVRSSVSAFTANGAIRLERGPNAEHMRDRALWRRHHRGGARGAPARKEKLNFRWHKQLCSAQPQLEGGPKHRSS